MPSGVVFARQLSGVGAPSFYRTSRPYSNFRFLEDFYPEVDTLPRILSQVRQLGGTSMVVERLSAHQADDLREETEDLNARCGSPPDTQVDRLSFFRRSAKSIKVLMSKATDDDFLGYAIVRRDSSPADVQRVYESVVRGSRVAHNYIRNAPVWNVRVADREFRVQGHIYAQQNGLTCVCAHVACRTACAVFHPAGDMRYREMNRIVGIDHKRRRLGNGRGLKTTDLVKILEAAGARCTVADYSRVDLLRNGPPFQKYAYGSIESGYPAIVVFETRDHGDLHAIPLFGHTLNQDTWVPKSERLYFSVGANSRYIPSESWVSTYVGHDDNCGSNYCIPRHFLHTKRVCPKAKPPEACPGDEECVLSVMGCLPQSVKVNPIEAEAIGFDYLRALIPQARTTAPTRPNIWASRLERYYSRDQLVIRPVLVEMQEYARHLHALRDWRGKTVSRDFVRMLRDLPKAKVWMLELSVPELFSANQRKIAEVLIRAERRVSPERTFDSFLLARLPGFFALRDRSGFFFIGSGANDHVALFGCEESSQ